MNWTLSISYRPLKVTSMKIIKKNIYNISQKKNMNFFLKYIISYLTKKTKKDIQDTFSYSKTMVWYFIVNAIKNISLTICNQKLIKHVIFRSFFTQLVVKKHQQLELPQAISNFYLELCWKWGLVCLFN